LGVKTWAEVRSATNGEIMAWAEAQPWVRDMVACQQDAQWHAEGDVWTHTKMVCAEVEKLAEWPAFDRAAQLKLLFIALFHDSGCNEHHAADPQAVD
jgi:HD-GYP domain-containing protein (c-di-GMP phosphodiesterase class II)